jgi:type I restriction enzyme S subunit
LNGRFDPCQNKYVPSSEHASLRTPVSAGTIIFCRKNSEEAIGAAALIQKDLHNVFLSDLLWELRPAVGVNHDWLVNLLKSDRVRKLIQIEATGTQTTMKNISQDRLLNVPVTVPPLPEQRKIAEILRTWDEAIEKLEVLRAAKERRFAAVAQRLLEPARAIGRHIPRSNWALTTFGEVFEERQDRNCGLGPDDVVTVGKYAIRKQSEHFSRSVASKDQSNYWTISPRDFVYDPMSAYYGALGRYDGSQDGLVSPAYRVIRLAPNVHSDFMVHLLRSHHIRFLLEARSSQGNKEGKRRLLQRDEFAGIEFNLPPIEVQQEIARKLADFTSDVTASKRQLQVLTRQKRGLMQKLLTGEWRVQVEEAA